MQKYLYILLLFAGACGPSKPVPPAQPKPMANAERMIYESQTMSVVPEISGGALVNFLSLKSDIVFRLTDSSINANSKIMQWESQVIVVPLAGMSKDIFLCNNAGLQCVSNPAMGLIEGRVYEGMHANNTSTIHVYNKKCDNDGFLRLSIGSSRKNRTPIYPAYKGEDETNVLIVAKVPISQSKATYCGGWWGGRLYSVTDVQIVRLAFAAFNTEQEAKNNFEYYLTKWQEQHTNMFRQSVDCSCERYADTDGDFYSDCIDVCPLDNNKIWSGGVCGCGVSDIDSDHDGVMDCEDPCPNNSFDSSLPCQSYGDDDEDGDVDLNDFAVMQLCLGISSESDSWLKCSKWDWDHNGVVDDVARFKECFSRDKVTSSCIP